MWSKCEPTPFEEMWKEQESGTFLEDNREGRDKLLDKLVLTTSRSWHIPISENT